MFLLLQSSCAKCYVFVCESKLSRQTHITHHITIVVTNIKKQKHRFYEPKKQNSLYPETNKGNSFRFCETLECVHITSLLVQIIAFTLVTDRSKVVQYSNTNT